MKLYSVIKRVFSGPMIHTLVCFQINKSNLKCNCFNSSDVSFEVLVPDTCNRVLAIREETVKHVFEGLCDNSVVILAKWRGEVAGHAVLKPSGVGGNGNNAWKDKTYIHYCYVAPQYRGKRIYPNMLIYLASKAFAENADQTVYISADQENQASICGIQKVGFRYWAICREYGWGGVVLLRRFKREKSLQIKSQ